MEEIQVDVRGAQSKEALHARIRQALDLPDWYGANLDALYDCLTSLTAPTRLLLVAQAEELTQNDDLRRMVRVCEDAAREDPQLEFRLVTAPAEAPSAPAEAQADGKRPTAPRPKKRGSGRKKPHGAGQEHKEAAEG